MAEASFSQRYGPWAVVVGASDGLGEAFARVLAGRGVSVVLAARRPEPLEALARELREVCRVEARVLAVDAGAADGPATILRGTAGVDVGIVVCNAALGPVGDFLELDGDTVEQMVALNCRTAALLCHGFGRRLVARGRGALVLLGSIAGLQGSARVAHYAATKAYLRVLAEGLWAELRPAGVDVVCCQAGRVRTPTYEKTEPRSPGFLAPPVLEPRPVVMATLRALGRAPVVTPGWMNRIAAFAVQRLLPRRTAVAAVSSSTRSMYPPRPGGSPRSTAAEPERR
jgi:short-subunit dehydrogenase